VFISIFQSIRLTASSSTPGINEYLLTACTVNNQVNMLLLYPVSPIEATLVLSPFIEWILESESIESVPCILHSSIIDQAWPGHNGTEDLSMLGWKIDAGLRIGSKLS
jgi:hypothetical protein